MKAQKKLNIVLIVLIIVLISVISFGGIFYKNKNQMVNRIPSFALGTDLTGYRKILLDVENDNENNKEELKNYDNFVKTANIIKRRLSAMGVNDYTVRCNESSGQIEITIPENVQTDYILSDIIQKGKFEITDSSSKEVLMNNDDIKNVKVETIQSSYSTSKSVYMNINFNSKGTKTFKNITRDYQNVAENNVETIENTTAENNEVENTTNEVAEDGSQSDDTKKDTTKKVSLDIDGTSMMTTNFTEIIDNGVLGLTLGNASTDSELKTLLYQAESLASILENDAMPLQYEISGNYYISSPIEQSNINIIIYIFIAIALIIFIITIIKYKLKGLLVSLCSVGYIALYTLVLRYANVVISLDGIFAIAGAFVINHIFNIMFLHGLSKNVEKSFTKVLKQFSISMIPLLIFSVVCCFSEWMSIFSFGMVIFWGLIISIIYNLIITRVFIKNI